MYRATRISSRNGSVATILCVGVALFSSAGGAEAQYAVPPISEGQAHFMATNSVDGLIAAPGARGGAAPLALLAHEAELMGHRSVGLQIVDGVSPTPHWSHGAAEGGDGAARGALMGGRVDVFMISPADARAGGDLDLFADLMIASSPDARLLVQTMWHGEISSGQDPDEVHWGTVQEWIDELHAEGGELDRLRERLGEINLRAGRDMAYVVPVADAVHRLRQEVQLGNVPGIERQSDLFDAETGEPGEPIVNLATYVWFVVMYRQPADGLTALVDAADPTSAARERLLERIAWDVAFSEPMAGVQADLLWPDGVRSKHDLLHEMGLDETGHQEHR